MRGLFLRIFCSFWLAMVLVGACLVVLALTADPQQAAYGRHIGRLERLGGEMAAAYRAGGPEALRTFHAARFRDGQPPVYLFSEDEGPLSGLRAPPRARRMAGWVAAAGRPVGRPGRGGHWLAVPLTEELVAVGRVPPPSPVDRWLHPYGLSLRLGAALLVTGLVSYLLARSLSAPLRRLRRATQALAGGDLSVRVAAEVGSRRDETAELARDFDRMAERIEELLAAQKRLLRDVSHELRSPLARLAVALELARRRAGPSAADALDRIGREADRLEELIAHLLTLTRLEDLERPVVRDPVELRGLLEGVVRDADFEARARGTAVTLDAGEEVAVAGHPELLRWAMENVIRNAVRFTPEGTAVDVRLTRDGTRARVTVRDRGPGVPEEALDRLFDPFYRVGEARERPRGGAGLGLAIAARAVSLHAGTVQAVNREEGGLEVRLELPVRGSEC
ncbi:MAG: HAMP domain-containing sensor histidine kinase [Deferrisomatales bacterium]